MKGLIKFFLALGAIVFFAFSIFTFLLATNLLNVKETKSFMILWLQNIAQLNVVLICTIFAVLSLIISACIFYASLKEKIVKRDISFGNPLGEVKVSLSAISDFIKKLADQIDVVKEVKPRVTIGRKGLEIYNKITLYSDANIPESCDRVQNTVKRYVQDVLGIQDVSEVKVFVEKIVQRDQSIEN